MKITQKTKTKVFLPFLGLYPSPPWPFAAPRHHWKPHGLGDLPRRQQVFFKESTLFFLFCLFVAVWGLFCSQMPHPHLFCLFFLFVFPSSSVGLLEVLPFCSLFYVFAGFWLGGLFLDLWKRWQVFGNVRMLLLRWCFLIWMFCFKVRFNSKTSENINKEPFKPLLSHRKGPTCQMPSLTVPGQEDATEYSPPKVSSSSPRRWNKWPINNSRNIKKLFT